MGYETKIYLGEVVELEGLRENGRYWFKVAVMVDLCKPGYESAIYKIDPGKKAIPVYFYGTDGNTEIMEDKYGKELTAMPARKLRSALREDTRNDDYRRFRLALDTINSFIRTFGKDAMAFLYGY